jgi:hypothetical protein
MAEDTMGRKGSNDSLMHKEQLFQQAANLYFDMLRDSGKPPRIPELIDAMAEASGLERDIVKSQLTDPEFDTLLSQRRKKRLIDEVAFKYAAAEAAERIGVLGLEKLTALIENGTVGNGKDADLTAKDLIAAVKLVSDLHSEVDKTVAQLTEGARPQVNINVQELLVKFGADGTARILQEANRTITAPKGEVIDGDCTEG